MADRPARDTISPERGAALPRDLARVLEWSRAHLKEPLDLRSLARIAGVPPRTLESHFARFLGTTPLAWLRDERLAHARRTLVESDGRTSASQAALDSGFGQLGRFAAQYCRHFGELPSETLRRIRRAGPDTQVDVDDEAMRLAW